MRNESYFINIIENVFIFGRRRIYRYEVSIIFVTEITDEVNRCYQPVDEKYEEGGE